MTPDQINNFFAFLYNGRLGEITFWLRLVAGVVTSAFLATLVVIVVKFRELLTFGAPAPAPAEDTAAKREVVAKPWEEVKSRLTSASPADWNLALIRADAVLDSVLKDMGLAGETMGDRLKRLDRSRLASLDDVWAAHKTRNRIVHDTDRAVSHDEAERAVAGYERALSELGYLGE